MGKGAKSKRKAEALEEAQEVLKALFKSKGSKGKEDPVAKSPKKEKVAIKKAKSFAEDMQLSSSGELRSDGKPRTFTEEGWRIYTEDELRLGQGQDTPLCPFDCDCCF